MTNLANEPLVTIGVTSFNAINNLLRVIQSAVSQTWRPLEIVVVDDFSTDGSYDLLMQLTLNIHELRVYRNSKNMGVAASRNRIIEEACGEFLVFFDDDDTSHPERIQQQVARLIDYERKFTRGDLVICHAAREIHFPSGDQRIERTIGQTLDVRAPSGLAVARRILIGSPLNDGYGSCATCSQLARLSTYRTLGGFDPDFRRSEDTDFAIRLALAGGHFVGVSTPLVIQKMTKTEDKSLKGEYYYMRLLLTKHKQFLSQEGKYDFCINWVEMKQAWLERRRFCFAILLLYVVIKNPLLTLSRFHVALPNIGLNRAFSKFHLNGTH